MALKEQSLDNLLMQADRALTQPPHPPFVLNIPNYYMNPDGAAKANAALEQDFNNALSLSLAWKLTQEAKYSQAAVNILLSWASICQEIKGDESRLKLTHRGIAFIEAIWNLANVTWNRDIVEKWIAEKYLSSAQSLLSFDNNRGSWGWCGVVMANYFLGNRLEPLVDGFLKHLRTAVDLEAGNLWREDQRTNSGIMYTAWALEALSKVLFILQANEIGDWFNLLKPAYKRLWGFCLDPESWPHRLPTSGFMWRIRRLIKQTAFPCSDELEKPRPGYWPSALYDTLAWQGIQFGEDTQGWLSLAMPICEGSAFRYSTLKGCYGLEP